MGDTIVIDGFEAVEPLHVGTVFGVVRAVGDGGRPVLIKTTTSTHADADAWSRLKAEYQIGVGLSHDNIVDVLDFVEDGPRPLLVMADRGGRSLRHLLNRGEVEVDTVVRIAVGVATGLAELHHHDIVHRDVKPDNIACATDDNGVEIFDLGTAIRVPRHQTTMAPPESLIGTLAYMAPEQTGRTARAVDHRSDLYAFGVTLYELLAGTLPFAAPDPLELVHQHLTMSPAPLSTVVPDIPPLLAELVERLMAKDPDDRYRSAVGVLRDLKRLAQGGAAEMVGLEGVGISTRFQLPDRLYGRGAELARLQQAFETAADGVTSAIFVSGFSGIGKSSLIDELRSSVSNRRGYQAVGKIDQMDRGSAHHAILGALRDLVRQLLTESDQRLAAIKAELTENLGPAAALLVEAVPELGALLGPVPPAPKLEAVNERNVFNQLISSFLSTVATVEHPLVMVLDDLQWADATTIDFVERTYRHLDGAALLIVGAYRDNEVDDAHPLSLLRRRLGESGVDVPSIELAPLDDTAMGQLIATALNRSVEEAAPLVQLCIARTASNPFFVKIFLQSLYEDAVLSLDHDTGGWVWDLERLGSRGVTANVAELAVQNVDRASAEARTTLAVMAIIGTEGEPELLTEVGIAEVEGHLAELAGLDLIQLSTGAGSGHTSSRWFMAHDRIQESASALLEGSEAVEWHRRIGEALQRRRDAGGSSSLFALLRHRNLAAGATPISGTSAGTSSGGSGPDGVTVDRELAKANLAGAEAAMRATSYRSALEYYATGIAMLGDDQWDREPDTAFALHLGAADAARLATDYDEMYRWLGVIGAEEQNPLNRVQASQLEILHLSHEGRNFDAVDVARQQLAELGWQLPKSPKLPTVIAGLMRTRAKLRPFSIESLERLDEMEDETARAMIRVMNETFSAAYFADPNILALLIQKGLQLTVKYGNAPESAFCYASHGMVMAGIAKKPEAGLPFGDLGVRLADRYGAAAMPSRVRYARDSLVAPVKVPLRQIGPSLETAYQVGMETGDVGYATAALLYNGLHRLLAGVSLDQVIPELEAARSRIAIESQDRNLVLAEIVIQYVHDLAVGPGPGGPFSGPAVDGEAVIESSLASGDRLHTAFALTFRGMSRWHHGDGPGARADMARGGDYVDALLGQAMLPVHHLYRVLAETGIEAGPDASVRAAGKHRRQLAWFAKHNPDTHSTALLIADGAISAARGRSAEAAQFLNRAIEQATDRGVPHDLAVASRLLAEVHQRDGRASVAGRWRQAAAEAYRLWGSEHFADRSVSPPSGLDATATIVGGADAYDGLDLATVVTASEAIGEEIELGGLLSRLLDVMLRNAGAELGVLYRVDDTGDDSAGIDSREVTVEVSGSIAAGTDTVRLADDRSQPVVSVAESVVRLVARTGEPVITDRAIDDPLLRGDPVVADREIRSLLCLPLVNQGKLNGILYLENNQVDGAFTAERFRLLRILSSQAAGALEKARLLDAQTRLIEAQGRFVPVQFLESLGHSNLLAAQLGQGILKEMDMVFTDIRGFTTLIEGMAPATAMEFINNYLSLMEPIITDHGGFIDTYEGDAILALFDAGSDAGIKAAVSMAQLEHRNNRLRRADGLDPIRTGFGINTDSIMMGIVGGPGRMQAGIVGDGANLASRVESLTKRYRTSLLAAENTVERLGPTTNLDLRPLERVLVVGRVTPVRIFEVLDALDDGDRHRRLTNLPRYLDAMAAYEDCRFDQAHRLFSDVVADDPDDGPAALLAARALKLSESGAPTDEGPPITRLDNK